MIGNDLYMIDGFDDLSGEYLRSLILLYSEITSPSDVDIYLKMLFLERNTFKKINDLLSVLNISVNQFEKHLHILEKVNLISTYNKNNEYIFVINSPLGFNDFFEHPIYGRLLVKRVSRNHFYYLKSQRDMVSFDLSDYEDISDNSSFEELSDWDSQKETDYRVFASGNKEIVRIESYFDIDHFMKNISATLFPLELRTNENLNTIGKLADAYSISESDMRRFLNKAISINPLKFDDQKLNLLCKNAKGNYEDIKDGYEMPCAAFLSKYQNGKELVPSDLNIIDQLINKYYLKPEVVNVALEYSLKRCDNQLIPKFIYAVAANLNRNNIENAKQALDLLNRIKKNDNKPKDKDVLPEYDSSKNIMVSNEDIEKYLKR